MKKFILTIIALLPLIWTAPALASVIDDVQTAIKNGNFAQINVIAAKNPTEQGDIAMFLLEQSQNKALGEQTRFKVFDAVAPFGSQIDLQDSNQASAILIRMLAIANDPGFQQQHPREAGSILATVLSLSGQPNILTANPNLHDLAVADAGTFAENHPDSVDKRLQDEVDLALQIGLPPPLGPRGIVNPSQE